MYNPMECGRIDTSEKRSKRTMSQAKVDKYKEDEEKPEEADRKKKR